MALTVNGKRPRRDSALRLPATAAERGMADQISAALLGLGENFDAWRYADAIAALNPDALEALLDRLGVGDLGLLFEESFAEIFREQGEKEYSKVRVKAGKDGTRQTPPQAALRPQGRVDDNGFIIPTSLAGGEGRAVSDIPEALEYLDSRATFFAQTRSAQLVREIDDSNRLAIRSIITDSFKIPVTTDETARRLEQVVGLHTRWANAVLRFKDENYARMIRDGMTPIQAAGQASKMAAQYRNYLIKRRALMIARTEIQQAQNLARQAAWNAGSETGEVDPQAMKEWVTAPRGSRYGPPCPICMELRGSRVPWNGLFANGFPMPPAHPHCRCTAVLVPPTRGLTGLPSQGLDSWLEQLDAMDEEAALALVKHGDPSRPNYAQLHPNSPSAGGRAVTGDEFERLVDEWITENHSDIRTRWGTAGQWKESVARRLTDRLDDVATEELVAAASAHLPGDRFVRLGDAATQAMTPGQYVQLSDGQLWMTNFSPSDIAAGIVPDTYVPTGTPQAERLVRQAAVSHLVLMWAASANDQNVVSLAVQKAARDEFGIKDALPWQTGSETQKAVDDAYETHGGVYRRFVRAQYDETQQMLSDMGVSEVGIHRGIRVNDDVAVGLFGAETFFIPTDEVTGEFADSPYGMRRPSGMESPEVKRGPVAQRPLSSWATSMEQADVFTGVVTYEGSKSSSTPLLMSTRIPASKILATPFTGVGCLGEHEVVVIAGDYPVEVYTVASKRQRYGELQAEYGGM